MYTCVLLLCSNLQPQLINNRWELLPQLKETVCQHSLFFSSPKKSMHLFFSSGQLYVSAQIKVAATVPTDLASTVKLQAIQREPVRCCKQVLQQLVRGVLELGICRSSIGINEAEHDFECRRRDVMQGDGWPLGLRRGA